MKVLLFPGYVSLATAECYSARLFELLKKKGVPPLEGIGWDGEITSLPTEERVIVRASTQLKCDWKELAMECQRLGHLLFYDRSLVLPSGEMNVEALLPAAEKFLSETMSTL